MNGSKRTISRILAFVMLVSAMFTNVITANADVNDVSLIDSVVSSAAAVVDEIIDDGADDLAADPSATGDAVLADSIFEVGSPLTAGDHVIDGVGTISVYGDADANTGSADWTVKDGDASGDTITTDDGSVIYTHFVQGIGNPSPKYNSDGALAIPTSGAYIVIKPSVKATLTADVKINGNDKHFAIMSVKDDDQTQKTQIDYVHTEKNGPAQYKRYSFGVEPGYTYYMTGSGSKFGLYAIQLVAAEETQDTTKEEETQATTDAPTGGEESGKLGTPEAGKTYTEDLAAELGTLELADQTALPVAEFITSDKMLKIVNTTGTSMYHGASYGLALKSGDSLEIAVAGNADLIFTLSAFAAKNGKFTITDSEGAPVGELSAYVATDKTTNTFNYIGGATVLKLAYSGTKECYIPKIEIVNKNAVSGDAKSFGFMFDDMAKDVDGTKTVNVGLYEKTIELNDGSTVDLGDTTVELVGMGTENFTPYKTSDSAYGNITRDGRSGLDAYRAGGRFSGDLLPNGKNDDANTMTRIPKQGEGTCIIVKPVADGMLKVFTATNKADAPLGIHTFGADGAKIGDRVDSPVAPESYALNVTAGNTYVFSTTGKTNDFAFVGLEYVLPEQIEVSFTWDTKNVTEKGYDYSKVVVKLKDADLGGAAIEVPYNSAAAVKLMKGHTYSVETGVGGCEATVGGNKTFKATENTAQILLTEIPDTTLTGKFIGAGTAADVTKLEFVSMTSGDVYPAVIDTAANSYSCTLKPGDYNTVLYSDKWITKDRARVGLDGAVNDIYLESTIKSKYNLPDEYQNKEQNKATAIIFNNNSGKMKWNNATSVAMAAGDSVVVPVSGKQKVTVSGWYSGTWDIDGKNPVTANSTDNGNANSCATTSIITDGTVNSVTINASGDATIYLYQVMVEDVTNWDAAKTTLQVPSEEFPTLKSAVAYIRSMEDRPEGEAGRMTIKLTADIQEQIVFDAPYITVDGSKAARDAGDDKYEINWYYGQTGKYYSCDASGYYDESLFYDKFDKTLASGDLWGGVAIIRGDYFKAENVTFRNTFNYEVTDKEIEDGCESVNIGLRTKTSDVQAYKSKERSNAFYIEAKGIECYNCNILSSQDTLGRNHETINDYSAYFKNCTIGGNTDYICGEFSAVFDDCELQWFSFKNDASNNTATEVGKCGVGYIVAPKTQPYVFRNCQVTTRGAEGTDEVKGLWGRTWKANSQAYFIDCTTNGHILDWGWGEMGAGEGATAKFYEYGNTTDGTTPFLSNGEFGKELTDQAVIDSYTGDGIITDVLGGWTPEHYDEAPPVEEGPFTWTASKEVADNEILLDNENATIKAEQAMSFAENAADRPDGVKFANGVTANAFNKTSSVNTVFNGDNNCKYRLVATITAKDKPINITIANYFGSVKPVGFIKNVEFSKNDAGEVVKTAATGEVVKTEEVQGGVFCTYDLKPGESITYGGSGTNPEVYGINITPLEVNESAASFDWYIDDLDTDKDGNVDPGTFDVEGSKIQLLPGFDADKWVVLNVADSATPGYAAFGGRAEAKAYKSGTRPQKAPGYDAAKVPTSGSGVVFTPGKDGMLTVYFAGQDKTLVRDFVGGSFLVENSSADAPGSIIPQSYSLNVVGGHQYAIHASSKTNNYAIAGIKFTVNEEVTVPLKWTDDGKANYSAVNVEFVDADLGNVYATVKNGDAEVKLLKGHRYTVKSKDSGAAADVAGANTFTVTGDEVTINFTEVPDTKLSGKIIDDYDHVMADAATIITGIKFVNMSDPTREYTGVINADGTYTVDPIKPGEYNTVITAEGYTTQDRVSVTADEAKNVNDVYVESTTPVVYPTEFKAEINVPGDYDTLTEANAAIKAMTRPEGEAGRVTIKLNKTLQEQVVFDADYVTLDGQGNELNWYYGTTGNYYSMDKDTGLYSKSLFLDKYEKSASVKDNWGRVAIIRGKHFKTVNTTYRNTFNYEVTPKEVEDGAVTVGFPDGRKLGDDVTVYAAKERSNAFWIEAANIEVDNCKIYASQDTFGRNGTDDGGYSVYVKNSTIGGNTDYICGEFKAVFDNCKLEFYAYENDATHNAAVGYIVAPKTNAYVFRNCEVTTNGKEGTDPVTGLWGRTWGVLKDKTNAVIPGSGSKAYFVNCETNGHILEDGWGQMNAGDINEATFGEYGNTSNGEPFVTHGQYVPDPEVKDEATIKSLTTDDILEFALGGWLPDIYELSDSGDGLWGDVDADNDVDAEDVSKTLQYTLAPANVADPFYPARADVTDDGKVDSADVAAILQKVLDGSYKLPAEKHNKPVPPAEKEELPATTVWVVGDSTACHYTEVEDPLYWFKRVGFGDKIQQYLDPKATVENLALSGRSSKSFATGINENGVTDQAAVDNYAKLKSEIKPGDYLIIAWGHNDEKTDAYRQTVPAATPGDYTQEGSFEKSLYDNYIKIAQDAGATPILCTPIIRANASGTLSNNDLHKPATGDYSVPIKALGEKLGILVVDSLANTENLYNRLGAGADAKTNEEAKLPDVPTGYMTLHAALQDKAADTTHLNAFGASMVAYMMVKDIRSGSTGLEKYIGRIQEPTFNNDECRNPAWEAFDESIYNPSSIWKFGADSKWAGSVFGSSVGTFTEDNHPNCDIVLNEDQSVTLMAANNKGKIASDRDGITMYFQEIDADQPFTLTATAHIDEVTDAAKKGSEEYDASNNQAGFGLMLRDNMFTDYNYDTNAHYFAVGSTAQNSGKNDVSVWRRKTMPDGSAKNMEQTVVKAYETTDESKAALPAGSSFDLKISRDANGVVTLQRGTEDPVVFDATTGADTNLKAVKADKDYVGMFVSRKGTVTFSNIKLELQ